MLRLHELLRPYVGDLAAVHDLCPDGVDIRNRLRLPAHVAYRRCRPEDVRDGVGAGELVLALYGPKPPARSDLAELRAVVGSLRAGGRALLMMSWPTLELPYNRLLGPLVEHSCQILQVAPLHLSARRGVPVPSAVVVERVERLLPLRAYLADPDGRQPGAELSDALAAQLRVVNEYLYADFVARDIRRRYLDLEQAESRRIELERRCEELTVSLGEQRDRLALQDRSLEEQRRALDESDQRVRDLEARIAAMETSPQWRTGRAVIFARRHPVRFAAVLARKAVPARKMVGRQPPPAG